MLVFIHKIPKYLPTRYSNLSIVLHIKLHGFVASTMFIWLVTPSTCYELNCNAESVAFAQPQSTTSFGHLSV